MTVGVIYPKTGRKVRKSQIHVIDLVFTLIIAALALVVVQLFLTNDHISSGNLLDQQLGLVHKGGSACLVCRNLPQGFGFRVQGIGAFLVCSNPLSLGFRG